MATLILGAKTFTVPATTKLLSVSSHPTLGILGVDIQVGGNATDDTAPPPPAGTVRTPPPGEVIAWRGGGMTITSKRGHS